MREQAKAAVMLMAVVALTAGCAGTSGDARPAATAVEDCYVADQAVGQEPSETARTHPFLGLSTNEARELAADNNLVVRVLGEDGQCPDMMHLDQNPNRINLELTRGSVTSAAVF